MLLLLLPESAASCVRCRFGELLRPASEVEVAAEEEEEDEEDAAAAACVVVLSAAGTSDIESLLDDDELEAASDDAAEEDDGLLIASNDVGCAQERMFRGAECASVRGAEETGGSVRPARKIAKDKETSSSNSAGSKQ